MSDIAPVAFLIGGGGGIGSVTAKTLADLGWRVHIAGRDAARLEMVAKESGATAHTLDARDIDAVSDTLTAVARDAERIDAVVNFAGSVLLKPAHRTSVAEWEDTITTNLTTAFALCRASPPLMRKHGGSIVLLASAAAEVGISNHEAISAAKAGVVGLMRSAAASYAPWNVRVNAVAPGMTETQLTAGLLASAASAEASKKLHPLGRIATPSDVSNAVVWLCDPRNAFVTGQVIGVDGGLSRIVPRAHS